MKEKIVTFKNMFPYFRSIFFHNNEIIKPMYVTLETFNFLFVSLSVFDFSLDVVLFYSLMSTARQTGCQAAWL